MRRLTITLNDEEYEKLIKLAGDNYRTLAGEIGYMIRSYSTPPKPEPTSKPEPKPGDPDYVYRGKI